ncbi:MAG TPA: multicopper oxidase domain-containing protein, partial [Casimicrobiaceae bacterium]|nr:multicopper oxidase domain-containing protein [Casimicrobiaceae bacterium]
MAYSATTGLSQRQAYRDPEERDGDRHLLLKLFALFAGLAVGVMAPIGIWLATSAAHSAQQAQVAASRAGSAQKTAAMPGMNVHAGAYATPSFAGIAPANADALAMRHAAFPAELPAATAGSVVHVTLGINHEVVSIAPGIRYDAWTFGDTAPGPTIHAVQGQRVVVTLRNDAPMPHSVDFHAAQVAPNQDFSDVLPGKTKTFSFVASTP